MQYNIYVVVGIVNCLAPYQIVKSCNYLKYNTYTLRILILHRI